MKQPLPRFIGSGLFVSVNVVSKQAGPDLGINATSANCIFPVIAEDHVIASIVIVF
jgi:hypothetical protein